MRWPHFVLVCLFSAGLGGGAFARYNHSGRKKEVPQNDKGEKQPVKKIEFEQEQVREQYEARLAELKKIADSPRLNGEVMWTQPRENIRML